MSFRRDASLFIHYAFGLCLCRYTCLLISHPFCFCFSSHSLSLGFSRNTSLFVSYALGLCLRCNARLLVRDSLRFSDLFSFV
ncbi:hypothetical protein D3C84_625560 [compost metagenome]